MDVKKYLDATYLKTSEQANLSESENDLVALKYINQAIEESYKLIMIRPNHLKMARQRIRDTNSKVLVGTVIDFPLGQAGIETKLQEAQKAIDEGADELDFVCDYMSFKNGFLAKVKQEIIQCTKLALDHHKTAKWIIEVAALTPDEIVSITRFIKECIIPSFDVSQYEKIFIKSSTGFYITKNNSPNGATLQSMKLIIENAGPLKVKAAGGVKSYSEAVAMIQLGVTRIGTSAAKAIMDGKDTIYDY
jgi:deoxyribose-phosphate aldolase